MATISAQTQIALLMRGHEALQRELEEVQEQGVIERAAMNAKITALENERNQALKWGVLTLGSALISLVAWIANKMGGHIQ